MEKYYLTYFKYRGGEKWFMKTDITRMRFGDVFRLEINFLKLTKWFLNHTESSKETQITKLLFQETIDRILKGENLYALLRYSQRVRVGNS